MKHEHKIKCIQTGSIAEEMEIEAGDVLLSVNNEKIEDIFDYQYQTEEEEVVVLIRKPSGEEWEIEIEKEADEDLGIIFENGLMDEYHSCHNKCIFCFIDQMPPGMRDTLYFKDDDSRLSFLQGNYVTLTNMSEHDIERIIRYRLEPINISFHTMNPELRCRMLHNRFAGEALKKVERLYEAGIRMNGQIVLCKGWNDKEELEYSIKKLSAYIPYLLSVSVVPVGLSRYRDGLEKLEPFNREDAKEVISCIHKWQKRFMEQYGIHFIHGGDEWYLLAEEEVPGEDAYDGYLQLENGVGMLRLMMEEFERALCDLKGRIRQGNRVVTREISMATGMLAYPYIKRMADSLMEVCDGLTIYVYAVANYFFGERITVSGLLTGQDIFSQLKGKKLGETLYLPENILRSGEDILLDDLRLCDISRTLQVPIDIVKSSGQAFVDAVAGICDEGKTE